MKLFLPIVIVLICVMPFVFAASGDATGMDDVFEYLGHDKPAEWGSWSKQQKFSYMQNIGLYPANGRHYSGRVASYDPYFEKLGVVQPTNWDDMTFDEKKAYLAKGGDTNNYESRPLIVKKQSMTFFSINYHLNRNSIILYCIGLLFCIASFFRPRNEFKQFVGKMAIYGLPLLLLLLSFLAVDKELFAVMGIVAELLLIFLLFVKPVAVVFKSRFFARVVSYRKELGIASFWFFFYHAAGLIYVKKLLENVTSFSEMYLVWGLIAGFGMVLLGITSNNFSLRFMKKHWKHLQYLAYPVLFASIAHSGLYQFGTYTKGIVIFGVFVVLKILEFSKVKFRK